MLKPPGVVVVGYALLLAALIAGSRVQRVGDAGEYMAMALNLSAFQPPSLSPADIARATATFRAIGSGYEVVPLDMPALRGADGRQDLPHFWLYSLFAVPALWIVSSAGWHPNHAFTAVNLLFLIAAATAVSRRVPASAAWLLMAAPIVWWSDKATNDAVTFSLLAIAFARLERSPGSSLAALGTSAALNPALGVVCLLAAVFVLSRGPVVWRDHRLWAGAVAGAVIALLPVAYYERRLGVPSPLFGWTSPHAPEARELAAFLIDPNLGLLIWFPLLVPALAVTLVGRPRPTAASIALAAACSAALLCVFAQSTNINHGGTPSLNRWTLWLVPLTIPLFEPSSTLDPRSTVLIVLAVLSTIWTVVEFRPARAESYLEPSVLARYVWSAHPAWWNPPEEIFAERASHREPPVVPAAIPGCAKALIVEGRWPAECAAPAVVDERCVALRSRCYANRAGAGYEYVKLRASRRR